MHKISLTLTPEESLVFLVCRLKMNKLDSAKMKETLEQGLDWDIVERYAVQLGVVSLLYKQLLHTNSTHCVPEKTMKNLRIHYELHGVMNHILFREVDNIIDIMNDATIPIVLLKGAFLGRYIYDDIALRPMGDIDMLIREENVEAVQRILASLGFEKSHSFHTSDFHEELLSDEVKHLTPLYKPKVGNIDIHLNIFPEIVHNPEDMEKVWKTMESVTVNGVRIKCLMPEYHVLYLCLHLYDHITSIRSDTGICLFWFCDICEIINHFENKINWDRFCGITNSLGVTNQVSTILLYVRDNWEAPVPGSIFHNSKRIENGPSLTANIRSVLDGSWSKRSHMHRYIQKLWLPLTKRTERSSSYLLLREIFPKRSNLIYRYDLNDSFIVCIYYIIHPCKLCMRVVTSVLYNILYVLKERL